MSEEKAEVVVLGAGIVGVSTAYAARERGMSVILVDRREPGSETSYGNAGIISSGSITPLNNPSLWKALPKYLTNRHAALRWNPVWAVQNFGWVARFLADSAAARLRPRAAALHGLIGASAKLHREWIVKAEAGIAFARPAGSGVAERCGTVRRNESRPFLAEYGIASELLDRQAISALEPDIVPVYKVGLLHTQTASVDSPGAVVKAYARMFARAGGDVRQADIKAIMPTAIAGAWCWPMVRFRLAMSWSQWDRGPRIFCGRSATAFRSPFERGYHREFKPNPARPLRRPVYDIDGGFIMTPMEQGIRVTSGVELTGRDAPSSFAQLDQVVPLARGVAEFGDAVGDPWRRFAANAARQRADDRCGAPACQAVACFRQSAHRLHDGSRDRRGHCRHDGRRAAFFRRYAVRAGGATFHDLCTATGTLRCV
jgi:D-amino-acid dehydrogenase